MYMYNRLNMYICRFLYIVHVIGVVFWSAEADAEQSSPVHVAHRAGSEATPPSSPVPPPLHMETDFNEEDCPTEVQDMHICTCTCI